jgi:hypothetical protein
MAVALAPKAKGHEVLTVEKFAVLWLMVMN